MSIDSKIFISDDDNTVSYNDLISFVSNRKYCLNSIKISSLKDFVFEFILSIVSNQDVVVLDCDLPNSELLGINQANERVEISPHNSLQSIDDILQALERSKSKITIFTSGTTDIPKKISHTIATLTRAVRRDDKHANDVWALAYNPTHIAGLQVLFQILFNKNTAVNLFAKSKEYIFKCIESWQITHISATPTFFRMLLPTPKQYMSVKRITCGGESSSETLYEKLKQVFVNAKINNIYASTEFGTLLVSNGELFKIPNEISDKVLIKNNRLFVHKDLLGHAHLQISDNGFYDTGDIVEYVDATAGLFKFVARSCNFLNVGGYKVNLEEVEDALRQLDSVEEVVVYGKSNSVIGNILCADIKTTETKTLTIPEIREHLSQKFQPFKIPRKIQFVEKISSTRTGKIKR